MLWAIALELAGCRDNSHVSACIGAVGNENDVKKESEETPPKSLRDRATTASSCAFPKLNEEFSRGCSKGTKFGSGKID